MLPMYEASANSPQTSTLVAIDDVMTEIPVNNVDVIPPAPNIIVLGFNTEVGETVVYTGIDGNTLTGCIRGFQGDARAWPSDTKIARVFTAYDHNAFIENILDLYARLDMDTSGVEELSSGTITMNGLEQTVFSHIPPIPKYICGWLDLSALETGDTVIVRMYINEKLHSFETYSNVLGTPMVYIDRRTISATDEYKITMQQSSGTHRNIVYRFYGE